MGSAQAQQYGLRSGPTILFRLGPTRLIKIRPYTMDLDQAPLYGQHILMSVFFRAFVVS